MLAAWLVLRDAERRADPTEEYDQIAVAVAAAVLLRCRSSRTSPRSGRASRARGRRRLRRGGDPRRAPARQPLRSTADEQVHALTDELHDYMVDHGARQDEVLARIAAETAAMGRIALMQIAPDQGAFMTLLCKAIGAREALELGTFTGYSAICIARGLPRAGA